MAAVLSPFLCIAVPCPASTPWEDRFVAAEPTTPQDLYGQTIRETKLRTPAEELAGFHVPVGFQVELIASEPTISKPMNMAFDGQGRLWITQSTQYPFPAKNGENGTDGVMVLEDKDKDGKFETSRLFADRLNIPIGLLPYGTGALCFSIPNIWYLQDTDGDGVCDKRDIVLGPFDTTRDTHGMVNSLRAGEDGWVYACHGFNNQSTVQGKDGHAVAMTSGNVFRFKPDGSRVELFTQGQVNPFGMAQDKWGFWYAADCHSKPISQLIRGGCYPSFGRPDDGLGFVPPMMEHLHGSTAISGLAHSKDSRFPHEFEDCFLSGNVMTCRINRNHLTYSGATAKANVMPDLLTSDDPWFRPVDLQFGPDGCLYVADFYNKVIGHYEVPLDHPDRDRKSGRIWRIRWIGGGETIHRVAGPMFPNTALLNAAKQITGEPTESELGLMAQQLEANIGNLSSSDIMAYSFVEKMGAKSNQSPNWLLRLSERVDRFADPVLSQSILIATRACLTRLKQRNHAAYEQAVSDLGSASAIELATQSRLYSIDSRYVRSLMRVLLALRDSQSIGIALSLCERQIAMPTTSQEQQSVLTEAIQSIADTIDESNMDRFLALLDSTTNDTDARGEQLLRIAKRQMQQRGKVLESLATRCRKLVAESAVKWSDSGSKLINWFGWSAKNDDRRDWPTEKRAYRAESVGNNGLFFSSFPLGESYVGTWKTSPFVAEDKLEFFVVGHNGLPSSPDTSKNYVCLVKLDEAGNVVEELFRAVPPRNDIASRIRWDLKPHVGAKVQLIVVDGDAGSSYAWIGIGQSGDVRFNPGPMRDHWERILSIVALCGYPNEFDGLDKIDRLLGNEQADWVLRYRLHRLRNKNSEALELTDFAVENNWMDLLKTIGIETAKKPDWDWNLDEESVRKLGDALCRRCSYQDQERLVLRLSKQRSSVRLIASLCEQGSLSRESLRVLPKSWWEGLSEESKPRLELLRPESSLSSNRQTIVESKASSIERLPVDLQVGAKQFVDRCAACHKLGDQGKVIGPQLEGAGARGILRLCEDILWPDRNVDEAFRMTIMVLDGGESANGLVSDRTPDSLLLTDQTGKQRRIQVRDIEQEKQSKLSLMPGNFDELMTDAELASLIGYLRASVARQ